MSNAHVDNHSMMMPVSHIMARDAGSLASEQTTNPKNQSAFHTSKTTSLTSPSSMQLALLPTLCLLPGALAWGSLGHMTVGIIAQSFLTPEAASWAQSILSSSNASTYLADVASWADAYRDTKAGAFSESFHFIDAQDSPPRSCNVDVQRDCGSKGCLVSAIANYVRCSAFSFYTHIHTQTDTKPPPQTSRLLDPTLALPLHAEALRFLVHFLGDITQPLHAEALARGGNDIPVHFGSSAFFRSATNLHHVWDDRMPEKLAGGASLEHAVRWAGVLRAGMRPGGAYAGEMQGWLAGAGDLADPEASATAWARDTNRLACEVALRDGVEVLRARDLSKGYYDAAVPVFSRQIAKGMCLCLVWDGGGEDDADGGAGGYRLANWLNLIAADGANAPAANEDPRLREREL